MNHRLTIQYDGTNLHGWQVQEGHRTVQGELETVLSMLEGASTNVHGAGRTDAGVHAEGQIANVNLRREWDAGLLTAAINGNIDTDIRVIAAEPVSREFHARLSARGKTYRYSIFNEKFVSPFWRRYALHDSRPLKLDAMREAAEILVGEHDWAAFSSVHTDVRTRVRRVTQVDIREHWSETGQGRVVEITVTADGFLRYMVRAISGALLAIGREDLDAPGLVHALKSGERPNTIATAAAHGLTLVKVHY